MAIVERDGIPGKTCTLCKEWKNLTSFSRKMANNKLLGDGYQSYCKPCFNIRQNARRVANHEETLAYERAYREANREKLRVLDCAHYRANRERHSELNRAHYAANPQPRLDRQRAYRQAHPDKEAAKRNRRRAREYSAPGSHTERQWRALKVRYDHTCLCCGKREPEVKLTRDHVVPLHEGGSDSIANIQPLCKTCNCSKGTKTIDYRERKLQLATDCRGASRAD